MERGDSPYTNLTRKQSGFKTIVDNVTEPYIMSTLTSVIDFIEDTTSVNHLIREQTPEEAQFIVSIPNFAAKESLNCILPQQIRSLVRELARALLRNSVTLRIIVRKGHGRHRLKDVEIFKSKVSSRGSKNQTKTEELYDIVNKKVEDYDPKEIFLKALSRNSTVNDGAKTPPPPSTTEKEAVPKLLSWRQNMGVQPTGYSNEKKPKETNSGSTHRSNSNYSLKSTGIQFQAAGSTADSTSADLSTIATPSCNGRRSRRGTVGARHSKLLEALATPLDCLPATRMMQKMGWTGGALGARGDGITEPIMPALDIVQGAGFGHSRDRSQGKREPHTRTSSIKKTSSRSLSRTPADFRITVLDNLLQLLKNDGDEIDFHLQAAACGKEIRFIDMALKSFNARKNVGLSSHEEKERTTQIKECFDVSETLFVEVEYTNSYRTVKLIKSHKDIVIKSRRRRDRSRAREAHSDTSDSSCSDTEPYSDALVFYSRRDLNCIKGGLKGSEQSVGPRAVKALTNRVAIFQAILKFVMSSTDVGTIAFQRLKMSKKLKAFIRSCIESINFRLKSRYSTDTEDAIYRNILKYSDSKLSVEIGDRHFILQKEDKRRKSSPQPSSTNTETSKTDKPIPDKLPCETNTDKGEDKNKQYINSDSESVLSLKDYEVYDINLQDSSSDESDSDKSDGDDKKQVGDNNHSGDNNQSGDRNKSGDSNQSGDINKGGDRSKSGDIVGDNNQSGDRNKSRDIDKVGERDLSQNKPFVKNLAFLNDGIDILSKEISNIDWNEEEVSNNPELSNLNIKLNGPVEKDTEKLLTLCKSNNVSEFLNDQNAKVSVSIDINMEINTKCNQKFTKKELIEKIENSPDINIDLGLTSNLMNTSKRSSEISDLTQNSVAKKSKIDFDIAKITFLNNISITKETVEIIQKEVFSKIDKNSLPLLKFLNHDEKSINYRCDNEYSFEWLKNLIENLTLNDSKLSVTLTNEVKKSRYKLKATLNSFFDLNSADLLKKIELYHSDIKVDFWLVLDVEIKNNILVLILDVDSESYRSICDANFSLYCGIDAIEFRRCYD